MQVRQRAVLKRYIRSCFTLLQSRSMKMLSIQRDWPMMRDLAEKLVKLCPEECNPWVWLASATRRSRSIMEAQAILMDALKHHDSEPTIHFNLACYAFLAGDLPLARERLARACLLEPKKHEFALKDSDLEPLWAELGKIKGGK
jgi:hypothetical protein